MVQHGSNRSGERERVAFAVFFFVEDGLQFMEVGIGLFERNHLRKIRSTQLGIFNKRKLGTVDDAMEMQPLPATKTRNSRFLNRRTFGIPS